MTSEFNTQGHRSIWDGDMSPPPDIYEGEDIHGNMSPNILEVMSFGMSTRVTATVVVF